MIHIKILSVFGLAAMLSGCGGGSSVSESNSSAGSVIDTATLLSWRPGIFEDESNYKGRCETPRTGNNINGEAYTDQAGSKVYEKHWLRSWSNNTYLWYDEIADTDFNVVSEPELYFSGLKSFENTASGAERDRFHYSQNTEEYLQLTSSGESVGYGVRFQLLESSAPREGRVAYVEPNSSASLAGLSRGDEIVAIDGVDFVNSNNITALNAGLLPDTNGEEHIFTIRGLGQTTTRDITLKAQIVVNEPVKSTSIINTDNSKVAYLALNTFATRNVEVALFDAFTTLSAEAPNELVIDLRYNGGGYLALSAQLAYMIAGPALTSGKVFEKTVFNNKHQTHDPVTGNRLTYIPFFDSTFGFSAAADQPLPTLNLSRVFVLTSGNTCSASESLINALRGIGVDVVLIGSTTCGKPYGFYPTDNCGVTYSTIQFRGENDEGFGDYADGFSPNNTANGAGELIQGCQVIEDVLHELGDENEILLKSALEYMKSSTCPVLTAGRSVAIDESTDLRNDPKVIERELIEQIRMDSLRIVNQ